MMHCGAAAMLTLPPQWTQLVFGILWAPRKFVELSCIHFVSMHILAFLLLTLGCRVGSALDADLRTLQMLLPRDPVVRDRLPSIAS